MENGSLVFSPFPAQEYRQDVHGAAYRCRAANTAGVVISRDMHVTAGMSISIIVITRLLQRK